MATFWTTMLLPQERFCRYNLFILKTVLNMVWIRIHNGCTGFETFPKWGTGTGINSFSFHNTDPVIL